ncbi:hypothetical protein DL766_001659 [Monosporascus sp. MC13-8B]|uniref:F-box domain-containing protein n=1 Tax=Monosporascus cannonballus TaxID=155416 RepID=A0ABY0GYK4_9PEZI|nr:hypothetical protein DL762_007698 [Monosporascus cannonballus]RYO91918.1 hypothetical protein DL763_004856 [Monosporascus cannonballus]RYP37085.1 hypothetical protein DL766_001659 [Monosporascus sp. MC13-8B]
MAGKSSLQTLPPELKGLLLMSVDIDSLPTIAKTCRAFYESYRTHRGPIIYGIASRALGGALPLAIASYAAGGTAWKARWPLPSGDGPMKQHEFTFAMASEMIAFHRIVEEWAPSTHGYRSDESPGGFYAIQICRELFPFEIYEDEVRDRAFDLLWHYFAPWENTLAWNIDEFLYDIIEKKYPDDDEDLADHPIHELSENHLATRWLAKYGIRGLASLGDDDYMRSSFKDLADDCVEHPFRSDCFCSDLVGCSWLKLAGEDIMIRSLDIDHILARYAEEENGARDYWFFGLADDIHCFKDTKRLPGDANGAAVWWDLPRINAATTGALPSMEKMQAMTRNDEYDASPYILETDGDYYQELGFRS